MDFVSVHYPLYPFSQLEGLGQLGVQQRRCSQERTMLAKTSCETFFLNKINELTTIYTKKYEALSLFLCFLIVGLLPAFVTNFLYLSLPCGMDFFAVHYPLYPFFQLEGLGQLGVQQWPCSQAQTALVDAAADQLFLNQRNELTAI